MKLLEPGATLDGFVIEDCLHAGGMAHVYRVNYLLAGHDPGFAMAMKVPRMATGDGAENLIGFEVETQILQAATGPHVPRFVAAGDITRVPYLVMEYIKGKPLQHWLDAARDTGVRPDARSIAQLGAAVAKGVHSLHLQNVVHQDLKPANVVIRDAGDAVLLDFGLSYHAHFPDLLAEEMRKAIGSPAWMAPEQVVGVRGDPRSDVFAIGVMLYALATGELPFGAPQTSGGLRQRLWMDPPPPRVVKPDVPDWLQEIILRCLEPEAAQRYPSAAHLAMDLAHPDQVTITSRGTRLQGTPWTTHLKRWVRAAGKEYRPSPPPVQEIAQVPIVMVALPYKDVTDATLYSLRLAVGRALGTRPGARLACVTVIASAETSQTDELKSETRVYGQHLERQRQWLRGVDLNDRQVSHHVLESGDVAATLVDYARNNHVSVLVLGAATHGLKLQPFIPTIPIRVAMEAPCTVILVKQTLPFVHLADATAAPAEV